MLPRSTPSAGAWVCRTRTRIPTLSGRGKPLEHSPHECQRVSTTRIFDDAVNSRQRGPPGTQKAPSWSWGPSLLLGDVDQKKTFAPNAASALIHVLTRRFGPLDLCEAPRTPGASLVRLAEPVPSREFSRLPPCVPHVPHARNEQAQQYG